MKTKAYVLDTSFIIALLNRSDAHHQESKAILQELPATTRLIVPGVVAVELSLCIHKYPVTFADVEAFLRGVYDVVEVDRDYVKRFMQFIEESKLSLRPNDYSVLHVAVEKEGVLLTFDQKLQSAYISKHK